MNLCERITSRQNPRVKHLLRLRQNSHRKRQGLFLIEGFRECQRALQANWTIDSLFFSEDHFSDPEALDFLDQLNAAPSPPFACIPMTAEVFAKVAYRQSPDGFLAVAHQRDRSLHDLPTTNNPFLIVLVGIEKPGNLGAIFRTADAAGADACLLADPLCDPFNPNAIRASQGAFFHLPFVCAPSADILSFLQKRAITPLITTPNAPLSLFQSNLRQPIALVLGTEHQGLPALWLDAQGIPASLPMKGLTDSLNVSSTAAIALFETVRQRMLPANQAS